MRNKFFDLIAKGVAKFDRVEVATEPVDASDDVVRVYNNIFSIVSDTHMSVADPAMNTEYPDHNWKYVITGSLIGYNMQRWEKFCCDPSTHAGAFDPRPAGFFSVADFLSKAGLVGQKLVLNGDVVYGLYSIQELQTNGVDGENSEMSSQETLGYEVANRDLKNIAAMSYVTTESAMPHPIAELSVNVNKKDVQACFKHKNNLYDVAAALNESEDVLGENWVVFENQIVGYVGNKTVIIK